MTRSKNLPPSPLDELRRDIERLKLTAMLSALDEALDQAQTLQQGYATFLAGLVRTQVIAVSEAAAERRRKAAYFPTPRPSTASTSPFSPVSTSGSSRISWA